MLISYQLSYQTLGWLSSPRFPTAFRHLPAHKHVPKYPVESKPLVPFAALISCYRAVSSTSICRRVSLGIIWQGPDPCSWCL